MSRIKTAGSGPTSGAASSLVAPEQRRFQRRWIRTCCVWRIGGTTSTRTAGRDGRGPKEHVQTATPAARELMNCASDLVVGGHSAEGAGAFDARLAVRLHGSVLPHSAAINTMAVGDP